MQLSLGCIDQQRQRNQTATAISAAFCHLLRSFPTRLHHRFALGMDIMTLVSLRICYCVATALALRRPPTLTLSYLP
jgi:hypothetical protein